MREVLHFYEKAGLAAAIVAGKDVLGLCGAPVEPKTKGGEPVFVTPTGRHICGDCLTVMNSRPRRQRGRAHDKQTLMTAAGA